jgi:hypothetical protein
MLPPMIAPASTGSMWRGGDLACHDRVNIGAPVMFLTPFGASMRMMLFWSRRDVPAHVGDHRGMMIAVMR